MLRAQQEGCGESDDPWERYLAALKAQRLTTYALVFKDVEGELEGQTLRLEFSAGALQQFRYALRDENAKALLAVAHELFGPQALVELTVEDSDERMVLGTAKQLSPDAERLPQELFAEESDNPEYSPAEPSSFDPSKLSEDADSMAQELEMHGEAHHKPPSTEDVLDLFDATEIKEEKP